MMIKIACWNINSVRLRFDQVARYLTAAAPDALCLQEIKTPEAHFPALEFAALGYAHQAVAGMKGYNGVAILSKYPLEDIRRTRFCDRDDARHIQARMKDVTIHSLYIPAGGDKPDPTINEKFARKLAFLDQAATWAWAKSLKGPSVLTGDFNIAPLEADVWDHKKLKTVVTHTPVEVEKLAAFQASRQWIDTARHFIPQEERHYTWWSYRAGGDWRTFNRGRRLDHIWVSPDLTGRLSAYQTFPEARSWDRPSDHVPVMMTLDGSRLDR